MEDTKNTRIAKNTIYLTIRTLLIMFISLYTSRVVLDKLGVEDFGIYNVVGGFVGIFSFLKTSFSNVSQRFLNIALGRNDLIEARNIFSQHLLLYVLAVVIIVIIAETIGLHFIYNKLVIPHDRLDTAVIIYQFSVITICINIIGIVYNSDIIAHENMKVFSYIGVVEGLFKLGIAFILTISHIDKLLLYGFLIMMLQLLIQLFNYYYCRNKYIECRFHFTWNLKNIKDSVRLIGWNFVNNITFVFKDQFLTVLLNLFFGPVVNSARAVTAQVNMAVNSFSGGFMTSVKPQIIKSYAHDDKAYLHSLFFKSSKFSFYIIYFLCLPITLCINTVLSLWLKIVPPYTDLFIIWNLLESICAVLLSPMSTMTLASGKMQRYVLLCNTANLMVFPLCYLGFSYGMNPVGAYIIAFLMRCLEVCFALDCSNRIIGFGIVNYLKEVLKPCISVAFVAFVCTWPFCKILDDGIISLLITILISILSLGVAIWFIGTTNNERSYIKNKFKNVLTKVTHNYD